MYFCICVHMCRRVHVNVCVMEQMVFRPLCAIEKSPYVFPGLTSVNTQCYTEMAMDAEDCQY